MDICKHVRQELSERSETGCRSLYKPFFIGKQGTTRVPQDRCMNEPLSFPLSLVCCVWMCAQELIYFKLLIVVMVRFMFQLLWIT